MERFLRRCGHRILARNYACPYGELDIVAAARETIVFVEVKTRASDEAQDPAEAVGAEKWSRVERAARHFLAAGAAEDRPYRFDLVTVVWPRRGALRIEHTPDAYQPRLR
ncbi:MAG: YraN family protein [Planctomycetes bacterium]|nr:YraN family protein [Planctomycetota bacterium]